MVTIRRELQAIRDARNYLLDQLEAKYCSGGKTANIAEEEDQRRADVVANGLHGKRGPVSLPSPVKETEPSRE